MGSSHDCWEDALERTKQVASEVRKEQWEKDLEKNDWPEETRIDIIGTNGGDAELYHFNHKHGHASSDGVSPTYSSWRSMKDRCCNPNSSKFYRYGERGIAVCDRWLEEGEGFKNFLADMGERPEGMSLGRIDNNGDYMPSNCRWENPLQQARNTSKTVFLEYEGEKRCISEWIEISGIPRTTFYRRYYNQGLRGDALFQPTIHMRKEAIFERLEELFDAEGSVNFTKASEVIGECRKTLSSIWKEFTGEDE